MLIQIANNLKNPKKQIPNSNSSMFYLIFHWNLVLVPIAIGMEFPQVGGYPQLELMLLQI